MPRRLVLVRHSTPEIQRQVPAAQWPLSAEGAARARAFAARLDPGTATRLCTSTEPKARDTARALADVWQLPVEDVPGLHEHERPGVPIMTREEFDGRIREMFERPDHRVFGAESAEQARRRFSKAVLRLVQQSREDIVVVTHGTVMALFVAACTGTDAFVFWKRQQMPCAATLALPELTLERLTFPE
jgi:broad specificity phosphatase PhoE